jgi:hypothetical protein
MVGSFSCPFSNFYFLVDRWLGGRKQGRRELAGGEGIERAEASSKFSGGDGAPSAHLSENGNVEL